MKLFEIDEENELIQNDSRHAKVYLKQYKGFRMNTFKKEREFARGIICLFLYISLLSFYDSIIND